MIRLTYINSQIYINTPGNLSPFLQLEFPLVVLSPPFCFRVPVVLFVCLNMFQRSHFALLSDVIWSGRRKEEEWYYKLVEVRAIMRAKQKYKCQQRMSAAACQEYAKLYLAENCQLDLELHSRQRN